MDLVTVAMVAGRRRIEVDARRLDRRLRVGPVAFRVVGRIDPTPHRDRAGIEGWGGRACTGRV
jgi:hypothetical protein